MFKKLINILFFLLCMDVVLDPGNLIFGVKELLFLATFLFGFLYSAQGNLLFNKNVLWVCMFFGFALPVYGVAIGVLRNQYFDSGFALMYVKSFLFIWLLLIQKAEINYGKWLSIASLYIIIPSLYLYFTIPHFDPNATYFFVENKASFISRRMFAGVVVDPVIYYKTLALSLFGISWLLFSSSMNRKIKLFLLIIILFVTFMSFSRAIILSIGVLILVYIYRQFKTNKLFKHIIFLSIFLGVISTLPVIFSKVIFVPGEQANLIKLGHFYSYLALFKNDTLTLLVGQGLGAGFYSSGFGEITHMAELSYLELIRFFGLFGAGFIIFILIYPLVYYLKNRASLKEDYIYIAYALYLFCVGTNPLLISSTGMVVLVVVYSTVLKRKEYEKL